MAARSGSKAVIVFDGFPTSLHAVLPVAPADRKALDVSWPDGAAPVPIRVLTSPAGPDRTHVRLMLPADTAPGSYEAVVRTSAGESSAIVTVRPRRHLRLTPSYLNLDLSPNGTEERTVEVVNDGNVAYEIKRAHAMGLFLSSGLDQAIGASLTASSTGVERLGVLADTLADNHGGLLRIAVRKGSGTIAPGEWKQLVCSFQASERLQLGRVYFGTWRLQDLRYSVHVYVEPADSPAEVS